MAVGELLIPYFPFNANKVKLGNLQHFTKLSLLNLSLAGKRSDKQINNLPCFIKY